MCFVVLFVTMFRIQTAKLKPTASLHLQDTPIADGDMCVIIVPMMLGGHKSLLVI